MRDKNKEFNHNTIRLIADRAGHRCSICGVFTTGAAGEDGVTRQGQAAHIYPVSKGGPRYDEKIDPDFIKSHKNGIWLCCNCHSKVDNKKATQYTAEELFKYKENREKESHEEAGIIRPFQSTNINDILDSNKEKNNQNFEKKNIIENNVIPEGYGMPKTDLMKFKDLNGYLYNKLIYNERNIELDKLNNNMSKVIDWVIGYESFPDKEIKEIYKDYRIEKNKKIINLRRKALINYFNGNLDSAITTYNTLYNRRKEITDIWLRDDMLIDGRNLLIKKENINRVFINNKFQKLIEKNKYNIYHPTIDRLEKESFHKAMENITKYKYKRRNTIIYGLGLEQILNNMQQIIYISILYGSYTQLLVLRKTLGNILMLYAECFDDNNLYKEALKLYALSGEYRDYKFISDKIIYKNTDLVSKKYINEILKLRNSILVYNKFNFEIFIYDYFGRLLTNTEYTKTEKLMLQLLQHDNYGIINNILETIPSNIPRIHNMTKLLTILKSLSEIHSCRIIIQRILDNIEYNSLSEANKVKVKYIINQMIINDDYIYIIDLLINIKEKEKTKDYDDIIFKGDNQLLYEIYKDKRNSPKILKKIVDEIAERNNNTINTGVVTSYATVFSIDSQFFNNDSVFLRKVINDKLLPMIIRATSSRRIELHEKIKYLKVLLYVYNVDNKYKNSIEKILSNMQLKKYQSTISNIYDRKNIKLYLTTYKYLFSQMSKEKYINYISAQVITDNEVIDEVYKIISYLYDVKKLNTNDLNYLYTMIVHLLNCDQEYCRVRAIYLIKLLNTNIQNLFKEELMKMARASGYNDTRAIIWLISEIQKKRKNKFTEDIKQELLKNDNYNIRYMAKKYVL